MPRRLRAFLLLTLFAASTAEAAVGNLAEPEVHHESAAQVVRHAASGMDHASLDEHADESGTSHRHGTSTDHCTHVHVATAPTPAILPTGRETRWISARPLVVPALWVGVMRLPPPRV